MNKQFLALFALALGAQSLSAATIIVENRAAKPVYVKVEGTRRIPIPVSTTKTVQPGRVVSTDAVYFPHRISFFKDAALTQPAMKEFKGKQYPAHETFRVITTRDYRGPVEEAKKVRKALAARAAATFRYVYTPDELIVTGSRGPQN